jgi:hypothetical protein
MKIIPIHDIKIARSKVTGEIVSNFPRTCNKHSEKYAWGYGGSGPNELALNILMYFTSDIYFSERYRTQFTQEILMKIPIDENVITISGIEISWFLMRYVFKYDQKFKWPKEIYDGIES